eukprot:16437430-Heterocapsa_arctica.AAC.1
MLRSPLCRCADDELVGLDVLAQEDAPVEPRISFHMSFTSWLLSALAVRMSQQHSLAEGDEVALVPVASGFAKSGMTILLDVHPLDDPSSMSN